MPPLWASMKYIFNYHRSDYAEQLPGMPVLGGSKPGEKLSGDNYVKAIYLGYIIRGQFSGWQLFGGNYQYSIILWGNSLSTNCSRANYPGAVTGEAIFYGATVLGAIIRGQLFGWAIVQGVIVLSPCFIN